MNDRPAITAEQTVREVLARFPATVEVFARHGLGGCGGEAGPAERLDVFAVAHQVPVEILLRDLNERAAHPESPPVPAPQPVHASELDTLHRRFVIAALLSTLTLGAIYGAVNLLTVHLGLSWFPYFNHPLHATFQVYGFVLLFILGVGYHAVPRFLGTPLGAPRAARASLPLILGGMALRGVGVFATGEAWASWTLLGGAALLCAGIAAGAIALVTTARAAAQLRPYWRWLVTGTGWWAVSALVLVAGALDALVRGEPEAAWFYNEGAYAAALFGGALFWIVGMLFRLGPAFLSISPPGERAGKALFAAANGSVALLTGGALLKNVGSSALGERLYAAGLLACGLMLATYVLSIGIFRRPQADRPTGDEGLRFAMQVGCGFALVFAALAALHVGLELTRGSNHLVVDAARHAFAQGFIGLTILAVATRVLPIFGGVDLAWPKLRDPAVLAIAVGVALRLAEVGAALGWPALLAISGISGLIAGAGVSVLAVSLLVTLSRRPPQATHVADVEPTEPRADMKVAEIVDRWPAALGVLIDHGFGPLANPVARRTLARAVTLEQACRMHGRDPEHVLASVKAALAPQGGADAPRAHS